MVIMKASVFVCGLTMLPVMVSSDHEGNCVCMCVLKMYPAMVSSNHEGKCVCVCVEDVFWYGIW